MRLNWLRGLDLWVVVATVAGIGTLLAALAMTSDGLGDWGAGVLVNIGASVLLIVPVYILTKRLDKRIERVGSETRSSVQALADRVETFEQDVERRIEDVAASVAAQLEQERHEDKAAFTALGSAPSRDSVLEALRRANELGLISQRRGPRVCVSDAWRIFVRIDFNEAPDRYFDEEEVSFTLETFDGNMLAVVLWPEDQDVEAVMVKLGRSLLRETSGEQLDVRGLFEGMSRALSIAQTDPERRPIWQVCPPQWVVTEHGIHTYGGAPYYGAATRALEGNARLATHIAEKTWVDPDSLDDAVAVALALSKP
ncbi:hypothetical protein ONA91_04475 [Micromonospora sp. DR5-3]|uniref:hypothetical protein n=1 Tax=unclassified Micromonospora TaxID=2617518 RepID=UPI0011D807A4|nr:MULTISPECIES: hypothetical protein [unclassified Micromonospora]MCW3813714.1 hypothetical protein [Micromonospora sp. DR5-3]TYC25595.1 hypothetical protein FXF52_04020 [Micromonospora sp. MP36]